MGSIICVEIETLENGIAERREIWDRGRRMRGVPYLEASERRFKFRGGCRERESLGLNGRDGEREKEGESVRCWRWVTWGGGGCVAWATFVIIYTDLIRIRIRFGSEWGTSGTIVLSFGPASHTSSIRDYVVMKTKVRYGVLYKTP